MTLTPRSTEILLDLAHRAIRFRLDSGQTGAPDVSGGPAEVLAPGASFVTLSTREQGLRGCCGSLDARRPLALDVWHNAQASAFDDPRFPRLQPAELERLDIEISVLGPLEAVPPCDSEAALLDLLVPGRDGVVLSYRGRRATFLPKVWENLPGPRDFLAELKRKAGLPRGFWSDEIQFERYRSETLRAD